MTRRAILSRGGCLAGVGLATALAGCGGGGGGGDGGSGDGGSGDGGTGDGGSGGQPTEDDTPTETDRATETPTQTDEPPQAQLEVVETVGSDLTEEGVGTVTLTVTRAQSTGTVDLRSMTVRFSGTRSQATLWHESVTGSSNTVFRTAPADGGPGSGAILADADDQTLLSFDLGGGGSTERLRPSDTATVELGPDGATATTVELVVPPSLEGEETVALQAAGES